MAFTDQFSVVLNQVVLRMMVNVKLHPHGIASILNKIWNLFVCIKHNFFLKIFLYLIYYLSWYNRNKTRPWRDHESNFKKWVQSHVGAMPVELRETYATLRLQKLLLLTSLLHFWTSFIIHDFFSVLLFE